MSWSLTALRRCCAFMAAVMICCCFTLSAVAKPSPAEKETARGLVRDGRAKLKRGDLDEALADFRAAHEIMNVPTTGLELGKAQAKLGMLVEALDTLLAVTRMAALPGESRAFAKARRAAKKLAQELAPRVSSVRVMLRGDAADGASVSIDGKALSPELVGAPYKVNPGVHEVIATADGDVEERAQVTLDEGDAREVVLSLNLPVATERAAGADDGGETHPLVWVGLGLAGVGTVVGSVTGALALGKHADVAPRCPGNQCPPETHDDLDSGLTLGTVSTVMFVVAGVGAAATVVGLFLPYGDDAEGKESEGGAWLRMGPGGVVIGASM